MEKKINITQEVDQMARPIAAELGLLIWDVEFKKEGSQWYLRIFIDKHGGPDTNVSIDDCEAVYRRMDTWLDEKDFIAQSYLFEVSSPGLERELKKPAHFEYALGREVAVRLYKPADNCKTFSGVLTRRDTEQTAIQTAEGERAFANGEIANIKTIINW